MYLLSWKNVCSYLDTEARNYSKFNLRGKKDALFLDFVNRKRFTRKFKLIGNIYLYNNYT